MNVPLQFETDVIPTSAGNLQITFLGHGTLMLSFNEKVIHVDPYSKVADYSLLPRADFILITHEHHDHLDMEAINLICKANTDFVMNEACRKEIDKGVVLHNGETQVVDGIPVEAVPAYNIQHKREGGQPFHPKGQGNGYILTFGDTRLYIAGDTENTPEMKALEEIDIAFLPMNLPYTMTPEMVADAARAFRPKILYPYHFGNTDTGHLKNLLAGEEDIEVRIRSMA